MLQPRFVPGLTVRGRLVRHQARRTRSTPSTSGASLPSFASIRRTSTTSSAMRSTRRWRRQCGPDHRFPVRPQNVAHFRTAGLDFNVNYRLDPRDRRRNLGTFNLNLLGNYLDRLEFIGTPGARRRPTARGTSVRAEISGQCGPHLAEGRPRRSITACPGSTRRRASAIRTLAGNPDFVDPRISLLQGALGTTTLCQRTTSTEQFQFYGGVNNISATSGRISAPTPIRSARSAVSSSGARVKLPSF